MKRLIIALTVLLVSHVAHAECRAVPWPYAADVSQVKPAMLKSLARPALTAYLYSELSTTVSHRTPGLAKRLLIYLVNTEQNKNKAFMFETLQMTADLETKAPTVYTLKDLCAFEEKALRAKPAP
jgi:hypothetical protein